MVASITQHGINLFRRKCLIFLTGITVGVAGCNSMPPATPTVQVVTPTPAQVATSLTTSPISPIAVKTEEPQWLVYQGSNSYRGDLLFEIRYDSTQWKYSDGDPFGPALIHLRIPNCFLALSNAGNPYSDAIATVQLADRDWTIFKTSDASLLYLSSPFGFTVFVTENPTTATQDKCKKATEDVLDSFKPLAN